MAIKTLRTILEYSNPSVVREFQIDDRRTIRELILTIGLIHGWETDSDLMRAALSRRNLKIPETRKIQELLSAGTREKQQVVSSQNASRNTEDGILRIRIPVQSRKNDSETEEYWIFRLEEMPAPEDAIPEGAASEEPLLIRARGLHPSPLSDGTRTWNRLQYELMKNSSMIDYGLSRSFSYDRQVPKIDQINRNLMYQIRIGRKPVRLNKNLGMPLQSILDRNTAAFLKELIQMLHLGISVNQKKAKLVESVADALNTPEFWRRVLEEMDLYDYMEFTEACTSKNDIPDIENDVLIKYGLLLKSEAYWADDKLPSELMEYYADVLYRDEEAGLLKEKKLKNALEACRMLYAVFSKAQAEYITGRMYPSEFSPEEFDTVWKKISIFELLKPDVMYSTYNLDRKQAGALYNNQEQQGIPYYTPDGSFLRNMTEEGGLTFKGPARTQIENQLKNMLRNSPYHTDTAAFFAKSIYTMLHLGWTDTMIEKRLRDDLYLPGNRNTYRKLFELIDKYKDEVYMVALRGHSVRTLEAMNAWKKR